MFGIMVHFLLVKVHAYGGCQPHLAGQHSSLFLITQLSAASDLSGLPTNAKTSTTPSSHTTNRESVAI
jgi:hypothetical protein